MPKYYKAYKNITIYVPNPSPIPRKTLASNSVAKDLATSGVKRVETDQRRTAQQRTLRPPHWPQAPALNSCRQIFGIVSVKLKLTCHKNI